MTIALLATGDEIIHGDTLNTNSHQIAAILSAEGLPLGLHLSCSDKEKELYDCLNFLSLNHNIIIMIGGLGPTSDDRTRFALEKVLQTQLTESEEALIHIANRLGIAKEQLDTGNKQQSLFPSNAILLANPRGTALGCYYTWQNKVFILLPGPPSECLPMFTDFALPLLRQTTHSDKQIFKWRLFGVAESIIGQRLDHALAGIDCHTGYRLEIPYIECKVRCKNELAEQVKQIIEPIFAPYLIATPEQKASERLLKLINKIQKPIAIIDDVTGGILQSLIHKPDNYAYLKFYTDKNAAFQFHLRGLNDYWTGKKGTGQTALTIEYRSEQIQGEEASEIRYFNSPWITHSAAEWLSFRLFHLINQLH